jgi:hypothetical protein
MFVNDAPPSSVLAETHGKPKFELKLLAAAEIATATNGRRKRHIVAGSYGYVVKIEFDRLGLPSKERLPRRHIGVQPSRQEWRRHIEHQYIGVVVCANCIKVFVAHRLRPSGDEFPKFRLIVHGLASLCRVCHGFDDNSCDAFCHQAKGRFTTSRDGRKAARTCLRSPVQAKGEVPRSIGARSRSRRKAPLARSPSSFRRVR